MQILTFKKSFFSTTIPNFTLKLFYNIIYIYLFISYLFNCNQVTGLTRCEHKKYSKYEKSNSAQFYIFVLLKLAYRSRPNRFVFFQHTETHCIDLHFWDRLIYIYNVNKEIQKIKKIIVLSFTYFILSLSEIVLYICCNCIFQVKYYIYVFLFLLKTVTYF